MRVCVTTAGLCWKIVCVKACFGCKLLFKTAPNNILCLKICYLNELLDLLSAWSSYWMICSACLGITAETLLYNDDRFITFEYFNETSVMKRDGDMDSQGKVMGF